MNARFRWLTITPLGRAHLARVALAMQAKPYGRDTKSGYSLSTVRAELIEGAYTERLDYVQKILDPFGAELSIARIEFRRTEFRLGTAYPQLQLRNPARQIKPLINLIGNSLDFQVAVTPISLSPLAWAKALAKVTESVQVLTIRSTKFSLSNDAHASVVISGARDVRPLLLSLLCKRSVDADSVVCGWGGEANEWRVELRTAGCAIVTASPVDDPARLLRKALGVASSA